MLQVVGPYLTKVAVDKYLVATTREPSFLDSFLSSDRLQGLAQIAALYLATLVISFALDYAQTYTMQMVGQRAMYDLRMQMFDHLHRAPNTSSSRPQSRRTPGDARYQRCGRLLNEMFTSGSRGHIFGDFFSLLFILAVMLKMNAGLALVAFSVLPLIVIATNVFRTKVREYYRRIRTAIARINTHLQEHITGMSVVQLFNRGEEKASPSLRRSIEPIRKRISRLGTGASSLLPDHRGIQLHRGGSHHLVWRLSRARRERDDRSSGGLYSVRPALLPTHSGPQRQIQHPARSHGQLGADIQAARRAGRDCLSRAAPTSIARSRRRTH